MIHVLNKPGRESEVSEGEGEVVHRLVEVLSEREVGEREYPCQVARPFGATMLIFMRMGRSKRPLLSVQVTTLLTHLLYTVSCDQVR